MKVSTKGRYGLRVMMELAGHYGRGPMPAEAIAKNQAISSKYIHVLVMRLRTAGLIRSVRGPGGGYELAKEPSSITALDVVSALEGAIVPVECAKNPSSCPRGDCCAVREVWSEMASAVDGVLSRLTLEELWLRQQSMSETPTYSI